MKLREYLKEVGIPFAEFARRAQICEATLHNILDSKHDFRLSFALRIEELTKGQVKCKELLSKEKIWPEKSSVPNSN